MKEFWNQRYAEPEYAYGKAPNEFLKDVLDNYPMEGSILLPAEGEGRNAVYAAKKGLEAHALDISQEGKNKALRLAEEEGVSIQYEVCNIFERNLGMYQFDNAALIYSHFPEDLRSACFSNIGNSIKPGGYLIMEVFSKSHLPYRDKNPNVGGPDTEELLYSMEDLHKDFKDFESILEEETEVSLNEGKYHIGTGMVIRFVGKKK